MSSSSITELEAMAEAVGGESVRGLLLAPLRGFAFWLAVMLPFTYLPLLAVGIDSTSRLLAFVVLVACNVGALVVGHGHRR